MKLTGVIDHYDDEGLLLKKAFAQKGVPPVIKSAVDLSDAAEKLEGDYALTIKTAAGIDYKYPVVDAGNTLASALYFAEKGQNLPEDMRKTAATNINKALAEFGFDVPEELTKTASMELGYSGAADDNSLEALFGLKGDSTVEIIEDAFSELSPRGKRRMAFQVKEASADLFEKLAGGLQDYASDTIGSDFRMAIDLRKVLLVGQLESNELDKIAQMAENASPEDVAEALHEFDVRQAITHHYNSVIPDSYASVFGSSVEKAASVSRPVEISGKEYDRSDISNWYSGGGETQLTDTFGSSFAEEFKSDPATVLDSLPITHKQAIARMIDES